MKIISKRNTTIVHSKELKEPYLCEEHEKSVVLKGCEILVNRKILERNNYLYIEISSAKGVAQRLFKHKDKFWINKEDWSLEELREDPTNLITSKKFIGCKNLNKSQLDLLLDPLNAAFKKYKMSDPLVIASFMSAVFTLTYGLRYIDSTDSGILFENRLDLGNVNPGDGKKYKPRGLLMTVGRDNYQQCANMMGMAEIMDFPRIITNPTYSAEIAVLYWNYRNLSPIAKSYPKNKNALRAIIVKLYAPDKYETFMRYFHVISR